MITPKKYKEKLCAIIPISSVDVGDKLVVDAGFPCIPNWSRRTVRYDEHGLFIHCFDGRHYLDGQIDYETNTYIGFMEHIKKESSA